MGERVMATERVADQTAHSDFYALNAAVDQALEMPVELVEPNTSREATSGNEVIHSAVAWPRATKGVPTSTEAVIADRAKPLGGFRIVFDVHSTGLDALDLIANREERLRRLSRKGQQYKSGPLLA